MEYVKLSNGRAMPKVGLGVLGDLTIGMQQTEKHIEAALEAGYRLFDTAYLYGSENLLGKTIQKWIDSGRGKREDIFIITKLPWNGMRPQMVEHFINLSLKELGLSYVDLYLIHTPFGAKYTGDRHFWASHGNFSDDDFTFDVDLDFTTDLEAIWKAMEGQVDTGKAKAIGISNFNVKQIERIIKMARIPPSNLQIEVHAYFQQKEIIKLCLQNDISVTAYSSLGAPWRKNFVTQESNPPASVFLLDDPVVKSIAEKHEKTPGQILLKFLLHLGICMVPRSSKIQRIRENLDVFGFILDANDLQSLEALDKGEDGRGVQLSFTNIESHPERPF